MNKRVIKVCTTLPTSKTPGAGLVVLKPSFGSNWKTIIVSPDPFKCKSKHLDHNMRVVQPKYGNELKIHRSTIVKRVRQIVQNFWILSQLYRVLDRRENTPLICFGLINLPACFVISVIKRVKLVISLHNATEVDKIRKSRVLRYAFNHSVEIWVCSTELKDKIRQLTDLPVFYRPTGFEPSDFRNLGLKNRFESRRLVSVGVLKWKKSYKDLICAMKILKDEETKCTLSLIGDGPLRDDLENQVIELGLTKIVRFMGVRSQSEIERELNESTLFVLPSVSEGRPKVVPEALSTGLPCIVTSKCNCDDIVEGAGAVVDPSNAEYLAEQISLFLDNNDIWDRASSQTNKRLSEFEWSAIAKLERQRVKKLFDAALKG